jgi:predicted Zn-dependent peptidase
MQDVETYRKDFLSNGLVVVAEEMPQVRSVSLGLWIKVGSRDEASPLGGISHFIEHLIFKGTQKRTAQDIARVIDSVGGQLDAFTSREYTCFYVKVLDKHLPLAVELLSDILLNSQFPPEEVERERQVVLQEINMVEDNPDDLIHDLFAKIFWESHPLGYSILGTQDTLRRLGREEVLAFLRGYYHPQGAVAAAAGNFNHQDLQKLLEANFAPWSGLPQSNDKKPPLYTPQMLISERDLQQVHVVLGCETFPFNHPLRYALYIFNVLLGGSMSSRLFQEIREKRGLAYSIFSYHSSFRDTGMLAIYAGTGADNYRQVIDLIYQELRKLRKEGITPDELSQAKEHLKGSTMLSLESTNSRMSRIATGEIYFGRFFSLDEIIEGIEAVDQKKMMEMIEMLFAGKDLTLAILGPVKEKKITLERI